MKNLIKVVLYYEFIDMFDYLVKEDAFLPAKQIGSEGVKALGNSVRREILRRAADGSVTVDGLVKELDLDRQTTYYHVRKLSEAGLLESTGSRPKYFSSDKSAYYYKPEFVKPEENPIILGNKPDILQGFIEKRQIKTRIIVGSPYPHGEYNRRHRTSYKTSELTCALGNYGRKRQQLVYTDTELEKDEDLRNRPLISIAGPLVNTFSAELNSSMPIKFNSSYDRIIAPNNVYSGEEKGFVARTTIGDEPRMMVAGLYGMGTSAAIEALSSRTTEIGEKGAIVRGLGTKHSIDEVEIIEKL